MKRGAFARVLFVIIGVAVGAFFGYDWAQHSVRWSDNKEAIGLMSGIGCAIIVYAVSGARLLIASNRYKVKLGYLQRQARNILSKTEDLCKERLEADAKEPTATEKLATAFLLQNEIEKSLHSFQMARENGGTGLGAFNNAGVALVRSGRLQNAVEMFEQAEQRNDRAIEPHSNLAHAFGLIRVGAEEEVLTRAIRESQKALELDGSSPSHHNRRGLILCRAANYKEAIEAFNKSLESATGNRLLQADAHNNLGIAKYGDGDTKGAMQHFQQALRLNPGHGRALANQGVVLIQGKTVTEGLERLQNAAALDPKSAIVSSNLGYALCLAKAPNEGILALRQAIASDPGMFEALYNLGKAYLENGITDMAGRYMTRALQVNPNSWQALVAMAVINIGEEKYLEARQNMEEAMRSAPVDVDVLTIMGVVLAQTFEFEAGEKYLRQALVMDKESAQIYGQLAWLHFQQQNVSLGSEELSIALGKDEKNPILNDNYGLSQLDLGSNDAALVYFRKALQFKPDFHSVHYHAGYVLAMRKKIDEAIPEWEIAAKHEDRDANVHTNLGVAYYFKDMMDEAVSQFRRVLTLRQDRMDDYSNLALAYAKQGVALKKSSRRPDDPRAKAAAEKFIQSVGMFDRALNLSPNNVILHSNRGLACFFSNRLEDAMGEWSMVSRLDAEYAKKRGALQQSVFDETAVSFVPIKVWERVSMMPLKTPDYLFKLCPGYDTDEWELIIEDENLAAAARLSQEADQVERNLRALHV